jgi:hypothetical protein
MTESNEQLHTPNTAVEAGPEAEPSQPAQEIVDPREEEPDPDARDVKIAGPREPEKP